MGLPQWHGSPVLMIATLVGDLLCFLIAVFGDATGRYRMPLVFWWVLWLAQIPLAIQAALGIALFAGGVWPRTPYHFMYGGLIAATLLALYGLRPGGFLRRMWIADERRYRESRWVMLLSLFLAGLVGRAYMTGMLGR